MRIAAFLVAAALTVLPAQASEPAPSSGSPLGGDDNTVEMPMLVAPVTVKGRLYHYAYMRVMLEAKDSSTVERAREKVPFIIDAMLRETHRDSIALDGDPAQIDGDGLKKRLLDAANAVVGPGSFTSLSFRDTIQTDDPAINAAAAAEEPPPEPAHEQPKTASAH
ncbi:MAG: hypothetical protein QM698_01900 [Micropepsaceae bacterium]